MQALAHIGVLELVLPGIGQLDRAARAAHGQRDDDALQRGAGLAAEAAADRLADDADLVQREIKGFRQRAAHRKGGLAGGPDGQLAVGHVLRGAGVGLNGHMLYMRDVEAVVEHAVGLGKGLLRVALSENIVVGDVRALLRIEDGQHLVGMQIGVNERRVRLHAFQRVKDRGQLLVFHLDEAAGLLRNLRAFRCDGGHGLTAELCRTHGEKVFVLKIQAAALFVAVAGDHAANAVQRLRLAGVDGEDLCVRIRAALDLRVQRPRETDIVRKLRGTRNLFDGVQPLNGLTYDLHFSYTPFAATASMASTIFL